MKSSPVVFDRGQIRRRLDSFVSHWRATIDQWKADGTTATEKSHAQQFWSDLLRCFGVIPERINLFEYEAQRASTGRHGWIDLFWSGVVLGEAKSLGRDLDAAYDQAMDYLAGGSIEQHEWPKYVLVSDFERIHISRIDDEQWTVRITIDEVTDHIDQLIFLAGQETITKREEERASIDASKIMARLYTTMLGDEADEAVGDEAPTNPDDEDYEVQRTSVFLTRILFLLYGDDAGLWEEDLFYRFILYDTTGTNLGGQLNALFQVLNTPESRRHRVPESMAKFPYVNGSLFADQWPQEFFNHHMRNALLSACRFHWTRISPAVFGSMFQLVKSKEARRGDGEHYTSETNILKVLEPLFLDELRDEADRLIRNKSTTVKALREFRNSLADHVFLDPACGSGNFLIIAYRELRAIETDIIVEIRRREGQQGMALDVSWEQKLSIDQFHGFEINWWPAKIAETAMFLVDHQANRQLAKRIGAAPERLPITITAHIRHGNALRIAWDTEIPRVTGETYVFGNPPFIGHQTKTTEQRADLKQVWGKHPSGLLDYVTAWHAKAMDLLSSRKGQFAYVTTSSITQGQSVPNLFGPLYEAGWQIKFAHRAFAWDSEAPGKAAVHCVIVGFARTLSQPPQLWDYPDVHGEPEKQPVSVGINGYLVDGPNILVRRRTKKLSPQLPTASFGTMPIDGGHLIVEEDEYDTVVADPIAAKYLRPFRMGKELVRGLDRWCLWMADNNFNPQDIQQSPILKKRVTACRDYRASAKPTGDAYKYKDTPHLMRPNSNRPHVPYVGIPRVVSENRRYYTVDLLPPEVIAGDKVYTAVDPDGLLFGLISSSMFITWQKAIGGRLESRLNFSSTITWNNFPAPELADKEKQAIIQGGKAVLEARGLHPERSLADHYNPLAMDPTLIKAHDKLDTAVDKALGAPRRLTTEKQRLEILFSNYATLSTR